MDVIICPVKRLATLLPVNKIIYSLNSITLYPTEWSEFFRRIVLFRSAAEYILEQRSREKTAKVKRSGYCNVRHGNTFDHTTCHVVTYAIPCCIWLVSGIGMSKYQPESARPRTSTLRPAILIRCASLSKLRITPIPPALRNQTNINIIPLFSLVALKFTLKFSHLCSVRHLYIRLLVCKSIPVYPFF